MTIVAKTGLLIEVRVIHMAVVPCLGRVARAASALAAPAGSRVAFCDDVGAFTSAGAPSFRLSKRAASTGVSRGSVVLISTRPFVSSRRPVMTMRRASLPLSIVQTYDCPASLRTAATGSVGAGALGASAMRPVANMPPRSAASGFGKLT